MLDFEQAAIQAFQKLFMRVQAVEMFLPSSTKFYEENRGARIEKGLRNKPRIALALKTLPALAFEKEEEIDNSYDKIVEEIQIVCNRTIKESEKIAKID